MFNFKGTINGVEYTDKAAFYAALKRLKHKNQLHVHVEEKNEPANKKQNHEAISQARVNYDQLLTQAFGKIFASFFDAQKPSFYNKNNEQKEQRPLQEKTAHRSPIRLSYECILRTYFFKDTTYKFTGGSEDEFHLDKFSGLLKRLQEQIKTEDLSCLTYQQKKTLYDLTIRNYGQIQENIETIEQTMYNIDARMASLENILNAYESAKIDKPSEIEHEYAESKKKFDIFQNKVNYYCLLLEHYRNIGPYLDPAI